MPTYPPTLITALAEALYAVPPYPGEKLAAHKERAAIAALDTLVGYTGGAGHMVEFRPDGYTLQHPLTERLNGTLFDCDLDAHMQALDGPPALGRHYAFLHEGQLHFTPADDEIRAR